MGCELDIDKLKLQKEEVAEVKWVNCKELEKIIKSKNSDFVSHDEEYKRLFAYLKEYEFDH